MANDKVMIFCSHTTTRMTFALEPHSQTLIHYHTDLRTGRELEVKSLA